MAGTQQSCSVLILGANGKLGRMVRDAWSPRGLQVVPVVRSGPVPPGGVLWEPGSPVPEMVDVRAVVALWGVTPGPGRDLAENTRLALAAMALGQKVGASAVLHCSSAAVYQSGPDRLTEDMVGDPPNPYGRAKLAMEQSIASKTREDGPRQIIMRIGNVAGADSLFANLRPGTSVTLDRFPDGHGPSRSYVAPVDLGRVMERLIMSDSARGVYNVAAPRPTAMADLVEAAQGVLTWRDAPEGAARQVWLDTGRLQTIVQLSDTAASAQYLTKGAQAGGVWP